MGIIKAEKVSFDYRRLDEEGKTESVQRAVDGVDLDVRAGDFVAILGHNGSGKSTLAKQINALLVPSEGTLYVDGMDTRDASKLWQIRQSAGMVFQNPDNQIIGTIVDEDVGFGPENMGVPTEEIWKRVEQALKAVGMWEYRSHSPHKLSGGQKQRVAIAGVVAMRPKCIVLDEPTAMLDPNGRKEVIRTVRELNQKEHVTVLLITHYMEEVICADKVIVMDQGKIVMQGTPREVFSHVEELKKWRLDVPQATTVAWELRKKGFDLPAGILTNEELTEELEKLRDRRSGARKNSEESGAGAEAVSRTKGQCGLGEESCGKAEGNRAGRRVQSSGIPETRRRNPDLARRQKVEKQTGGAAYGDTD